MLIGQRRKKMSVRHAHTHRQQTAQILCNHILALSHCGRRFLASTLTLDDVSQTLRIQQVLEASHFLFELAHQPVVGVLVDHGVAADLFSTISIPESNKDCFQETFYQNHLKLQSQTSNKLLQNVIRHQNVSYFAYLRVLRVSS